MVRRAPMNIHGRKKEAGKGAWKAEEDQRLSQVIEIHGPKRWKSLAAKAGLNRCGKSCRLRWMNYLRPNIKRGNISDQEEDLILRLHKLLGNKWSLIAGRLPGRTDNEIKNYWNSRLSKKMKNERQMIKSSKVVEQKLDIKKERGIIEVGKSWEEGTSYSKVEEESKSSSIEHNTFQEANEGPLNLEWMSKFLETDYNWF